ncbi:MAG: hypothetical protein WC378_18180 [Opitutaceae bacterium]|jgi:hypothetical protein
MTRDEFISFIISKGYSRNNPTGNWCDRTQVSADALYSADGMARYSLKPLTATKEVKVLRRGAAGRKTFRYADAHLLPNGKLTIRE